MTTQAPTHLRNEWSLLVFTATTNLADAVTKVALPLLAASLTRSPTLVAGVATMLSLPWLLTALHIGVLVDRLNRRSLMLAAELARLASIGVAFAAHLTGTLTLPLVFGVAGVLGVAEVVALTAGASIIPAAVAPIRRHKATAHITAVEYLCNGFLGAPVGGFLVAAGAGLALGVTGLVYAAGALLLLALAGNFEAGRTERRSVHLEIREGLNFLWQQRILRTMALLVAVMAGAWHAWLAILPLYAVAPGPLGLDARGYGLLLTCLGAGGVLGALLVTPVNRLIGRRWAMFADLVGSFLLVAVPAVWPAGWAVGAAAFAAGVGGTMWTVNARLLAQELVPDHLFGRFNAAYRLVSWGAAPVAAALAGLLTELAGFAVAFGSFAVLGVLTFIPFFRVFRTPAGPA